MTNATPQEPPARVPERAQQAGEARAPRARSAAAVWTDRMLTALENGVQGGVWFRLIDKVYSPVNLQAAFAQVRANGGAAGVDHQTIARFGKDLEANLTRLSEQLRHDTYRPQKIRRVQIPKPGSRERRPLGIPTVRDRVVQTALRQVIEPIFERDFAEHSYGFRPGRGCKDALRRVDALLAAGYVQVVDVDFKSYFDTIPHQRLIQRVRTKIADGRVLRLIESFLTQGVLEGMKTWTPTAGSPQGAVITPLLSNLYLDPLDKLMAESGFEMVRYADDVVILCRDAAAAEAALVRVRRWAAEAELTLHADSGAHRGLERTRRVGLESTRRVRLSGLSLPTRPATTATVPPLAGGQERPEARGRAAGPDAADERPESAGDHRERQPHAAWLV